MPSLSPPLQRRSQRTLERLLGAAERLLESRTFEAISVADIVARAQSSTGSFYARFESKEAMLPLLYERYHATLMREYVPQLESDEWTGLRLPEVCRRLIALFVGAYRGRLNLFRAVVLFARTNPQGIAASIREERQPLYAAAEQLFLRHADRIAHADPRVAVRFGLFMVASVSRERILFPSAPLAEATAASDALLIDELSRMLLAYLTCTPGSA